MTYKEMARRLEALEQAQTPADDGQRYVADIGATGPARYWIDGREVSADEYARRVPDGPFYVDIGDENEHDTRDWPVSSSGTRNLVFEIVHKLDVDQGDGKDSRQTGHTAVALRLNCAPFHNSSIP